MAFASTVISNKRAMLGSLGSDQINKNIKIEAANLKAVKNDNNK